MSGCCQRSDEPQLRNAGDGLKALFVLTNTQRGNRFRGELEALFPRVELVAHRVFVAGRTGCRLTYCTCPNCPATLLSISLNRSISFFIDAVLAVRLLKPFSMKPGRSHGPGSGPQAAENTIAVRNGVQIATHSRE